MQLEKAGRVKLQKAKKKDEEVTYVVNTNTKKFHKPDCSSIRDTKQQNRKETSETREKLIDQGTLRVIAATLENESSV